MKKTLVLLAATAAAVLAHADGGARRVALLPAYTQECGSCHAPFPPGLLPRESWQRLMQNLPRHFGTDASLDAAAQSSISDWLASRASTRTRAAPPEDRITRSDWFRREHREVPAAAWGRPAVGSAANCGACHAGAAQGDFDEDQVRIPR
ncbi:MAG: diheme cytochrome c [Piscinibacter sp.]|nr:diheme cytochrome c [Piscinibacter sp.]